MKIKLGSFELGLKSPELDNRQQNILFSFIRTLIAILISLAIVLVIILLVSKQPFDSLRAFLTGPFTSVRRMGNVVEAAIPLIFCGLAASVMFQAKQFSLIGDGAFFFGALMVTCLILRLGSSFALNPIVSVLVGGVVGGLCGVIPGLLKAKWNTNEFVVSMMFNYVLVYAGLYILLNFIRDPKSGFVASFTLPSAAKLPNIVAHTNIHAGLIIALVLTVLTYLFMYKTKWGFAIRMTGMNQKFAKYSGINTFLVVFLCQVIGGVIAGIGGTSEILGMYDRFQWQDTPGYGFDGMTVAILAANNPALVPVGALFLAYLRVGTEIMSRTTDVPNEVIYIVQGIVMLLVTATAFLSHWKHRLVVRSTKAHEKSQQEVA